MRSLVPSPRFMALEPQASYPGQVDVADPDYPLGKARNVSAPGSGDGFPLEQAWVNDLLGWQQDLLEESGTVASGDPDKVGASQYREAIRRLTRRSSARFTLSGVPDQDQKFTITPIMQTVAGAFTVVSNEVVVPQSTAWYLVMLSGSLVGVSNSDPLIAELEIGTLDPVSLLATRFSANPLHPFQVNWVGLMDASAFGTLPVYNRTDDPNSNLLAAVTGLSLTVARIAYFAGTSTVW